MNNILRWIFWFVCFVLRFVLIVIGWVLPPLWYETERTKGLSMWELYVENSWRNPTPYLRGWFKQPIPERHPNPDAKVRTEGLEYAGRRMVSGPYIEYWMLEMNDDSRWFKDHSYWEFRIGWKFVDGDDTFWPTIQLGPRR